MFNLGSGEIALIAVAALLILGPSRLPELARGIGKFMREFRRQTDEVRGVVEREFYKMDSEIQEPQLQVRPAQDTLHTGAHPDDTLPVPADHGSSQLTAGMPQQAAPPPLEELPVVVPPAAPPASAVEGPSTPPGASPEALPPKS